MSEPIDIPDFETLAADAEIAPLLDFEPARRKVERPDGWTPELQRELIARIAATGSPGHACDAMDKNLSGAKHLYRTDGADSFRAAWKAAIELAAERKRAERAKAVRLPVDVPGITRPASKSRTGFETAQPEEPDMSDDHKLEIIDSICRKYFGKARQEREARLSGEIVAADFYLRQMTFIEVGLDLAATDLGTSAFDMLKSLQRDGHCWMHIAETPFSRALDDERRRQWGLIDEPERPERPARRYFDDRGDYSLQPSRSAYGALTIPAEGFTQEQWAGMNHDEQGQARKAEWERAAEEQLAWEAQARAEFEQSTERSAAD